MKQKMQQLFSMVLIFAFVLTGIMTEKHSIAEAKAKVKLNKKKVTLAAGKKTKLKVKNYKKKVTWRSSKKKVATVNKKGVVTAKKQGTAKITAKAGKKKYSCTVTVKAKKSPARREDSVVPASEKPANTPNVPSAAIPTVSPGSSPEVSPGHSPAVLQDAPRFLCFKNGNGEEIQVDQSVLSLRHKTTVATLDEKIQTVGSDWINKDEMVLLELSYENKKRDTMVEIVLDDSDYGKGQIYTTSASVNKILNVDTQFDEEKGVYVTDVLIQMPKTKSQSERKVEVKETVFLRELTGQKGYADLSSARQTSATLKVSEEPIPSYSVYFKFIENAEGGYALHSLSDSFNLPSTLYIPGTYQDPVTKEEKPVTEISGGAFEKAVMRKLILPDTIQKIGLNICSGADNLQEIEFKGNVPSLISLALNSEQLDGGTKIIVPEKYVMNYYTICQAGMWNNYYDLMFCMNPEGEYEALKEAALRADLETKPEPAEEPLVLDLGTLYQSDLSDPEGSIKETTDADGTKCWALKFSAHYRRVFFELPETINLHAYKNVRICANVPWQMSFDIWDETFQKYNNGEWVENWHKQSQAGTYPFYEGSHTDRIDPNDTPSGNLGTETQTYELSTIKTGILSRTRYISLGINSTEPEEDDVCYIYSLEFLP